MEPEKKKRGRKPKADTVAKQEEVVEEPSEKKKRGRKPKSVYNAAEASQINMSNVFNTDDENIIVRLNISSSNESMDHIHEEHPFAYNSDNYRNITNVADEEESSIHPPADDADDPVSLKVIDVLKDFEQKNKNKEWPSNTSISCYWCCHKFENSPVGIPISYSNGIFEVYGCFCSLECAAAYNFKSTDSVDEVWERYNLINLLARKLNVSSLVKPAPDRLSLKMFGGFLDIDAFRNYTSTYKLININFPPMTSLTQQIEEINEYELNPDLKYIPIDHERVNRCKEKMIFRRTKPLINEKTTLESSMNLKYN